MTREYIALAGLNSKTRRYEAGDVVTDKDFSKSVLKHWLQIGRIKLKRAKPAKKGGSSGNG